MHAREWISPATVTYIANQLVEGWEDLPEHMRSINWYIHPVANPDGYEYSHTTDRLWRKNMRNISDNDDDGLSQGREPSHWLLVWTLLKTLTYITSSTL